MVALILFGLLVGLPILEVYTFIQVGQAIDVWPTIGLVLLTAMMGTALIRWQGMAVLSRAQASLARGAAPLREVFDGVCLLVAGALLLTPGFITDSIGFALILPPVRLLLLAMVVAGVRSGKISVSGRWAGARGPSGPSGDQGPFSHPGAGPHPGQGWAPRGSHDPNVLEGDYRDVTDSTPPKDDDQSRLGS